MPEFMKWYTDEAYDGNEDEWARMLDTYFAHVATIAPDLPDAAARLAADPRLNLHDARITELFVDRDNRQVTIHAVLDQLRALRLLFQDASLVPDECQLLGFALEAVYGLPTERVRTIVLAQELDLLSDGRAILRLRLWPFHEFGIAFRSLTLVEETAPHDNGDPGALVIKDDSV